MNIIKETDAIERLRAFAPKNGEPYYLCYSGGKDSDAIRILAKIAGVAHEIHHSLTTVDAPETIQYIKTIPGVIIEKARYKDGTPKTMWNLIPKKLIPPTRIARWCCAELKERGGEGRLKITGVRWEESTNRRNNAGLVRMTGKEKTTQKLLYENGMEYRTTHYGGIILNCATGDNEALRGQTDIVHQCYRDRSVTVNPIIDWSEEDVWDFLHYYGCEGNPLYKCGNSRIGCIACPMQAHKRQKAELHRYPKYKENYIKAFDRMIEERKRKGKGCDTWKTGEDVLHWWTSDNPDQLTIFDDYDLYDLLENKEE